MRNLHLTFVYVVPVKSKVKIFQNSVAFSEYMNFTTQCKLHNMVTNEASAREQVIRSLRVCREKPGLVLQYWTSAKTTLTSAVSQWTEGTC